MRFRFLCLLTWLATLASCRASRPSIWNKLDPALAPRMSLAEGLWRSSAAMAEDDAVRRRRLQKGEADLQSLLEEAPSYFPAHRLLQDVRLALDEEAARASYREVTEGADEIVLALAARACLPEDPQQARLLLEQGLERQPRFPWAHYGLGYLAWLEGDQDSAEDHVARALRFDSTLREAWLLRAELEESVGNWEGAVDALKVHQDLDPDNLQVLLKLAHLQIATEDPRLARHGEQRLLRILERTGDPPAPEHFTLRRDALHDLGVSLIIQERPHRALQRFNEVKRLDPDYLRAIYNIAWVHEHQLKDDKAALKALGAYLSVASRKEGERSFEELMDELFFVEVNMNRLRERIAEREAKEAEAAGKAEGLP